MQHPDDLHWNAYLDDELDASAALSLQAHLAACPACRQKLNDWAQLSAGIRQVRPDSASFSSDGEFWANLAARLPGTRREVWPWVEYLPPLLFAALGMLLRSCMSVITATYSLANLGLTPRIGPLVWQQIVGDLSNTLLARWLYPWVGQPSQQVLQRLAQSWDRLPPTGQEAVLFGATWAAWAMTSGVIVVFYWLWAICRREPSRPDHNGGC